MQKQLVKFQKQAEEWSEYGSASGYSLEASGAGLAGVRGQLELARALRELHSQEVRQELAQFEAVSPGFNGRACFLLLCVCKLDINRNGTCCSLHPRLKADTPVSVVPVYVARMLSVCDLMICCNFLCTVCCEKSGSCDS